MSITSSNGFHRVKFLPQSRLDKIKINIKKYLEENEKSSLNVTKDPSHAQLRPTSKTVVSHLNKLENTGVTESRVNLLINTSSPDE